MDSGQISYKKIYKVIEKINERLNLSADDTIIYKLGIFSGVNKLTELPSLTDEQDILLKLENEGVIEIINDHYSKSFK